MNLFRSIKATIFGTDYVILHLAGGMFIVTPVFWVGDTPSIQIDNSRVVEEAFIQLPASGAFTPKPASYYNAEPEYPFGYVRWEPITPKIKAYYKSEVKTETRDDASVSTKNSTKIKLL